MDYSKLNFIRNISRSIGLNRLLTIPSRLRSARRMREYEINKPSIANFQLGGHTIIMNVSNSFEWMRVQSFYEDSHIIGALSAHLEPGTVFWDIGTSIGLYSNYLAKVVGPTGSVISFEPEVRSRERLNQNIQINGNSQITVCPVALGKSASTLHMLLADDASAGTHRLTAEPSTSGNLQEVRVCKADDYQKEQSLPLPRAVKIDVEGFEEDVINGAGNLLSNTVCKVIVIEVHFAILALKGEDETPQRIISTLRKYGFTKIDWLDSSHLIATK